jgi:hypothetical protein
MSSYDQKNLYERIQIRQGEMEKDRDPLEVDCDRIINLFRPDIVKFRNKKSGSYDDEVKGILGAGIFEGTGPWAAGLMSDGFQGNLVSTSIPWIRYLMDDKRFDGNDEVNKWLQDLEEHMLSVYREPNSNFYAAMGPYTRHGITVGSPVIIPELDPDTGKIINIVPHPATRYFKNNAFGETDTLHLKHEWSLRNAVRTFKLENLSEGLQDAYKNGHDDQKVTIIRAIYFQMDRIFKDLPEDPNFDGTQVVIDGNEERPQRKSFKPRWPWVSIYIEDSADEKNKKPLRVEGYWTKPFSVWHYEKDQTETYSRTPAWFSYYDVKSANNFRKTMMMAAQKSVESAWWVPEYLKTKFKTYPRGMNWYNPGQAQMKPEQLGEKINYPFGFEMGDMFAKATERWFYTRMWFAINRLVEDQQSPPTATQILQMTGEKAIVLGPRVGRFLQTLDEIEARHIDIEDRRGNLPVPPDIVLNESDGKINPEFIGPLAQMQKRHLSIQTVQTGLAQIAGLIEIDPMIKHKVKLPELAEYILEETKFPQELITSQEEYEEILAAIAQQQMLREGIQMGTEVAKSVPSVSKTIEEGSPLAGLLEGTTA